MLKQLRPTSGPVMVENVILSNLTHRMKFEQRGVIPDAQTLLEKYAPQDGRNMECFPYMDDGGIGHVVLVWKEKPVPVGAAKEVEDEADHEDWSDK
jgi:hypothetical protein